MAMVISPRSKIVTLVLLIGIITLIALIITGVIGIWRKTEKAPNNGTKMVSSRLQQFTGYTATKHISTYIQQEMETQKSSERRLLTFNVLTPSSSALSRARRGTFKATTIFLLISFYYSPRRPNHVRTFVTLENRGGLKGGNPTDDESDSQHSLLRHSHSRMKFSVVLLVGSTPLFGIDWFRSVRSGKVLQLRLDHQQTSCLPTNLRSRPKQAARQPIQQIV
ncbi:collagen alpha-2(IX) chain isoform X7 [Vespula squamosa]|uniref:Collagen alpha-2(IX) chain isoform X7 n=1 Tax=Vespula squamosa TaxID=30214 RepID=A0ABD2AE25_VESSQ